MFEFLADVMEDSKNLKLVSEALKELNKLEVLVGIPQEKSGRKSEINNAELLYIHTNGSTVRNTPSRPVIEPAIADGKETIAELLKAASQEALNGNKEGMRRGLEKAGMHGQNISRAWFTNPKNGWPSLQDEAIRRREKKMSAKKLAEAKEQNKPHMPLIDTGELRRSIIYIVREK